VTREQTTPGGYETGTAGRARAVLAGIGDTACASSRQPGHDRCRALDPPARQGIAIAHRYPRVLHDMVLRAPGPPDHVRQRDRRLDLGSADQLACRMGPETRLFSVSSVDQIGQNDRLASARASRPTSEQTQVTPSPRTPCQTTRALSSSSGGTPRHPPGQAHARCRLAGDRIPRTRRVSSPTLSGFRRHRRHLSCSNRRGSPRQSSAQCRARPSSTVR
jgi:hypothetical protein